MARSIRRAREVERTRKDIVDAAARVFAAAGYSEATMQAIAREAGFTAASLYTYFKSKDEIVEALVDDLKATILGTFEEPLPEGLSLRQRLELLLGRQLQLLAERREALRMMIGLPVAAAKHQRHPQIPRQYLDRMTAFLAGSGADVLRCPPDEAARYFFGISQAVFFPWIACGCGGPEGECPTDAAATAARAVDFFLHGAGRAAERS